MDTSTPERAHLRRRLTNLHTPVVFSPLRKSAITSTQAALLTPANDEEERFRRRSAVDLHRRLTNITSSSVSYQEPTPFTNENEIQEHLRVCIKLFTENKITAKNAWQLHVIDIMKGIVTKNDGNVLQLAGSSLDVGAKIYGLRVDDVYTKVLQLASSICDTKEHKQVDEASENVDHETSVTQKRTKSNRAKAKKLYADKRNTIDKEEKNLFASIKHVDSAVFATKENIEISAIDNLFTQKLYRNPANLDFMVLSDKNYWMNDPDETLDEWDKPIDIDLPQPSHYNLCLPFKNFEIGCWDPDKEKELLDETSNVPEVILDENGVPITELDGSVHDIFGDNQDIPDDPSSDVDENQEEFQVQFHGKIPEIIDAVPEEDRIQTDYGYNTLIKTSSGKYIDKIWAGPHHWKVKFNRRSSARYSGADTCVVKQTRKAKVQSKVDFSSVEVRDVKEVLALGKFVPKRAPQSTIKEKITIPRPEIGSTFEDFRRKMTNYFIKPKVRRAQVYNNNHQVQRDYDVQAYNYDNPNDAEYCSQNNSFAGDGNEPAGENSFEEDAPAAAQQQFLGDNLVDAPETVSTTYIPYALHAKKMDMKKLKVKIWKYLTSENEQNTSSVTVKSIQYSKLYKNLPQILSVDMRKELSCPLVFVALLHLCNENNLKLEQKREGTTCFTITSAIEDFN